MHENELRWPNWFLPEEQTHGEMRELTGIFPGG